MVHEKIIHSAVITALIKGLFEAQAITIKTEGSYEWNSGWRSPIYVDAKIILSQPKLRDLVVEGFYEILKECFGNRDELKKIMIAGTENAGVIYAGTLVHFDKQPMFAIRDKAKSYGLLNRIEGIHENDIAEQTVVVIENVISAGGRAADAVHLVRELRGNVNHCLAIFNYDLNVAKNIFAGEEVITGEENKRLDKPCAVYSIANYADLLHVGIKHKYISAEEEKVLEDWYNDPKKWSKDIEKKNKK